MEEKYVTKWVTLPTQYVLTETGDILLGNPDKRTYVITKIKKHVEIKKHTGYIQWTKFIRTRNQLKFKFE